MSVYIASINSGSNGNCYYVGNDEEAVLIDAGISVRETERRMTRMGLNLHRVKAIFVSHEHGDHITGVPGLSKKYRIPVYITPGTLNAANIPVEAELTRPFIAGAEVQVGSLTVQAFIKHHDADDPHSFVVRQGNCRIGVFTDVGQVCDNLLQHFSICNAVFLEANYCEDMLRNGSYPYHLKRRISGGHGHLSNSQALSLFEKHGSHLSHLILAHLSKNNNDPQLVERIFTEKTGATKIVVASRYNETEVFRVEVQGEKAMVFSARKTNNAIHVKQLSLF